MVDVPNGEKRKLAAIAARARAQLGNFGSNVKAKIQDPNTKAQVASAAKNAAASTAKAASATGVAIGKGASKTAEVAKDKYQKSKEFMGNDWRQTKQDVKGAGKWAVGAGGAAAGMAAGGANFATTSPWPFFIAALVVYIYDFTTGFYSYTYLRLMGYLGLALWAWLLFYRASDPSPKSVTWPSIYSAIAFFSPILVGLVVNLLGRFNFLVDSQVEMVMDIIVVYVLAPIWIYVVLLSNQIEKDRVLRALAVFLIIIWVGAGVFALRPASAQLDDFRNELPTDEILWKTKNYMVAGLKGLGSTIKEGVAAVPAKAKTGWNQYMDVATAGYYTQNVEQNQVKTWVLKVQEGVSWNEEYRAGNPVTVEATFAGTRQEGKPIHVTGVHALQFGCRTKVKGDEAPITNAPEDVKPASTYLVNLLGGEYSNVGKQSVMCTINGLTKSESIEIFGKFDYAAASEIPALFTTAEKKSALVNSKQIQQYELKPITAVKVEGPVTIAMEFEEAYPLIAESGIGTVLRITVQDHDELYGKIQKLENIKIELPEKMGLSNCRARKDKTTTLLTAKAGIIDTTPIELPIDDFVAIRCDMSFQEGIDSIFKVEGVGERDVISKKIKVSANYVYEISKSIRTEFEEIPFSSIGAVGETGGCSVVPEGQNMVVTSETPCLSAEFINNILKDSPAKGLGNKFVDYSRKYGIDDAVALAFFGKESTFGTAGVAKKTRSVGNIKYTSNCDFEYINTDGAKFCGYDSWDKGIEAWYKLIKNSQNYVGGGKITVEEILPKYCPESECDTNTYVQQIRGFVNTWRGQDVKKSSIPTYSGTCSNIVDVAKEYLGCPYRKFNNGQHPPPPDAQSCHTYPYGFTCATYVSTVLRRAGYPAPGGNGNVICKNLRNQEDAISVPKAGLKPGDIISITGGSWGHVMIYVADNKVIHSTTLGGAWKVIVSDMDKAIRNRAVEYCRLKQCV